MHSYIELCELDSDRYKLSSVWSLPRLDLKVISHPIDPCIISYMTSIIFIFQMCS